MSQLFFVGGCLSLYVVSYKLPSISWMEFWAMSISRSIFLQCHTTVDFQTMLANIDTSFPLKEREDMGLHPSADFGNLGTMFYLVLK